MAYDAEEKHWLREGFLNGYFDYDIDELMAYCKENCGYEYDDEEEDEDLEYDYFYSWLKDYVLSLNDEEAREFLKNQMDADVNMDDVEYEITIPEEIIEMAEKKE